MYASFLSVIVYSIILLVSLSLTILYFYAWKEMKRTPIIGYISLLFLTIFIDNLFWFFMEFSRFITGKYIEILISAECLVLIKSILATGLVLFAYISVKSQDRDIIVKR